VRNLKIWILIEFVTQETAQESFTSNLTIAQLLRLSGEMAVKNLATLQPNCSATMRTHRTYSYCHIATGQ
jgi:hypothetical protein